MYDRENERKIRIFTFDLRFSPNLGSFHTDDFVTFLDPECISLYLIRNSLFQSDPSRFLYLQLFEFLGKIVGESGVSELNPNLMLLCLFCHCAIRLLAIKPVETLTEMCGLGLKKTVFCLYPGFFSVKELKNSGKKHAQIRCSREYINPIDSYIILCGIANYVYFPAFDGQEMTVDVKIDDKIISLVEELGGNGLKIEAIGEKQVRELLCEDAHLAGISYQRFLSDLLTTLSRTVFSYYCFSRSKLSASTKKLSACRNSSPSILFIMLGISSINSSSNSPSSPASPSDLSSSLMIIRAV